MRIDMNLLEKEFKEIDRDFLYNLKRALRKRKYIEEKGSKIEKIKNSCESDFNFNVSATATELFTYSNKYFDMEVGVKKELVLKILEEDWEYTKKSFIQEFSIYEDDLDNFEIDDVTDIIDACDKTKTYLYSLQWISRDKEKGKDYQFGIGKLEQFVDFKHACIIDYDFTIEACCKQISRNIKDIKKRIKSLKIKMDKIIEERKESDKLLDELLS